MKVRAHPNPYQLISVIVDELVNSCNELLSASLGKINKKKSGKTKKKLCRQKHLMEKYSKNNIDLLVYQLCIGNHYLKNSKKYGESNEKFDDEDYFIDDEEITEKELSSEIDDLVELQYTNFNFDLSKNTVIHSTTNIEKPRRPRKVTKRQKPEKNSRKSYSKFPQPNIETTSLMLMATAGAVLLGTSFENGEDITNNSQNSQNNQTNNENLQNPIYNKLRYLYYI